MTTLKRTTRTLCYLIFIGAVLVSTACGKTPENQAKRFDENVNKAMVLKSKHPAFGTFVDAEIQTATKSKDAALEVSDVDQQTTKLSMAAGFIDRGLVGALTKYDRKVEDVRQKAKRTLRDATDRSDKLAAETAFDATNDLIELLNTDLKTQSKSFTNQTALTWLVNANTKLDTKKRSIEKIARAIKDREREAAAANKSNQQSNTQTKTGTASPSKTTKPAVASMWKGYCGTKNPATRLKCSGCGSPKP